MSGDREFGYWKAGQVTRMESELVRNYRKKLEYQKSLGIETPKTQLAVDTVEGKYNDNEVQSDSGSEYSYFSDGDDGQDNTQVEEQKKNIFTQHDLDIIQRT